MNAPIVTVIGKKVTVSWMLPSDLLADFLVESLKDGPWPESHPGVRLDGPLMIFQQSGSEN